MSIGTCTSMALQYGVPLITLVDKFRHARFEPSGMTSNRDIPFAKSLIDYIFCWLGCQFIPGYADKNLPNRSGAVGAETKTTTTARQLVEKTKDLAHKIAEAKAAGNGKKKPSRGNGSKTAPAVREVKTGPVIPDGPTGRSKQPDQCPRRLDHPPARSGRRGRGRTDAPVQLAVLPFRRRRPRLRHLRCHHRPKRHLLQVLQLRQLHGLLLRTESWQLTIDDR